MKKHGIDCRILSTVLVLVMVLSMVPALQLGADDSGQDHCQPGLHQGSTTKKVGISVTVDT
jgi:hypothetical protein